MDAYVLRFLYKTLNILQERQQGESVNKIELIYQQITKLSFKCRMLI